MKLCIGASSRLVVEEGVKAGVHQIVASRRQVDIGGGYTGMDQTELVALVGGRAEVVRDHGGPDQSGLGDDGIASFDADVDAGFDGLHIDVVKVPRDGQVAALETLIRRYRSTHVDIEVGAEHDTQEQLDVILTAALRLTAPTYAVIDVGGHIHADRNKGLFHPVEYVAANAERYRALVVKTKAHNMDWHGDRLRYADVLDAYNVAPEFGNVEIEAWLRTLAPQLQKELLSIGYANPTRWFGVGEGTKYERSRAGLRYMMDTYEVKNILSAGDEAYVRLEVRDAILRG